MRKLFEFNLVTLNGYFEGPNRDISWHNVDAFKSGNVLLCYEPAK